MSNSVSHLHTRQGQPLIPEIHELLSTRRSDKDERHIRLTLSFLEALDDKLSVPLWGHYSTLQIFLYLSQETAARPQDPLLVIGCFPAITGICEQQISVSVRLSESDYPWVRKEGLFATLESAVECCARVVNPK